MKFDEESFVISAALGLLVIFLGSALYVIGASSIEKRVKNNLPVLIGDHVYRCVKSEE